MSETQREGDVGKEIGREPIRVKWGLLCELWCAPIDQTEDEQRAFLETLRENVGNDFAACPLEYIADRLYGGWQCYDYPDRHHVFFDTGAYGYTAAAEGHYWPNDRRADQWQELCGQYGDDQPLLVAPWTADRPERETA